MKNQYETDGDITTIKINTRDKRLFGVRFSTADLELVQQYHWRIAVKAKRYYYAVGTRLRPDGVKELVYLHRLVAKATEDQFVMPKDQDILNCQKENLSTGTMAQRQENYYKNGKQRKNASTTGERNIYYHEKQTRNPYIVSFKNDSGRWSKTCCKTMVDAIRVRDAYEGRSGRAE